MLGTVVFHVITPECKMFPVTVLHTSHFEPLSTIPAFTATIFILQKLLTSEVMLNLIASVCDGPVHRTKFH